MGDRLETPQDVGRKPEAEMYRLSVWCLCVSIVVGEEVWERRGLPASFLHMVSLAGGPNLRGTQRVGSGGARSSPLHFVAGR